MLVYFYVHLVNFPAIRHILWLFGTFSPVLVHFFQLWYMYYTKKNLATLAETSDESVILVQELKRLNQSFKMANSSSQFSIGNVIWLKRIFTLSSIVLTLWTKV
jgi:hypothetical protein